MPFEIDDYFFQELVRHLLFARCEDEAEELLLNYSWITAKLAATGIVETIADYDLLGPSLDAALGKVRDALRLSSHVLGAHPEELPGHLVGRLLTHSHLTKPLQNLLHQVDADTSDVWLRPMTPSLLSGSGQFLPHGNNNIS